MQIVETRIGFSAFDWVQDLLFKEKEFCTVVGGNMGNVVLERDFLYVSHLMRHSCWKKALLTLGPIKYSVEGGQHPTSRTTLTCLASISSSKFAFVGLFSFTTHAIGHFRESM